MSERNMEGKKYRHPKFGEVEVTLQPNYEAGGPRNVLIFLKNEAKYYVVPQRSLRVLKKQS